MSIPVYDFGFVLRYPVGHALQGQVYSGCTSVEIHKGELTVTLSEVGSTGYYYAESVPAGRYQLYVNAVNTKFSFPVGAGELAGLGYSNGRYLRSTPTEIDWVEAPGASEDIEWSRIVNAPTLWTPSLHSHAISDVSGLQSALDGKLGLAGTAADSLKLGGFVASSYVLTSDTRLSDARSPLAHTQAWSTLTGAPTTLAGYGIADAIDTSVNSQTKLGSLTLPSLTIKGDLNWKIQPNALGTTENLDIGTTAWPKMLYIYNCGNTIDGQPPYPYLFSNIPVVFESNLEVKGTLKANVTGTSSDATKFGGQLPAYYATAASLGNYLPLSAGSGKTLTGRLYAGLAMTVGGESTFYTTSYTDPDAGVARAIKIGRDGMAVLGGIKSDTLNITGGATIMGRLTTPIRDAGILVDYQYTGNREYKRLAKFTNFNNYNGDTIKIRWSGRYASFDVNLCVGSASTTDIVVQSATISDYGQNAVNGSVYFISAGTTLEVWFYTTSGDDYGQVTLCEHNSGFFPDYTAATASTITATPIYTSSRDFNGGTSHPHATSSDFALGVGAYKLWSDSATTSLKTDAPLSILNYLKIYDTNTARVWWLGHPTASAGDGVFCLYDSYSAKYPLKVYPNGVVDFSEATTWATAVQLGRGIRQWSAAGVLATDAKGLNVGSGANADSVITLQSDSRAWMLTCGASVSGDDNFSITDLTAVVLRLNIDTTGMVSLPTATSSDAALQLGTGPKLWSRNNNALQLAPNPSYPYARFIFETPDATTVQISAWEDEYQALRSLRIATDNLTIASNKGLNLPQAVDSSTALILGSNTWLWRYGFFSNNDFSINSRIYTPPQIVASPSTFYTTKNVILLGTAGTYTITSNDVSPVGTVVHFGVGNNNAATLVYTIIGGGTVTVGLTASVGVTLLKVTGVAWSLIGT